MTSYPADDIGIRCEDCGAFPDEQHREGCIYADWDDDAGRRAYGDSEHRAEEWLVVSDGNESVSTSN